MPLPAPILLALQNNPPLFRMVKNAGTLLGGNIGGAVINLFSLAILTRMLAMEDFGLFALLTGYIAVLDRLAGFQTWQAVIHYGAQALAQKQTGRLTSLFAFGFGLDAASGVAGFVLALAGGLFMPQVFGLDPLSLPTIGVAGLTLLFNWVATPTGVTRLLGRFWMQAFFQNVMAGLRLLGFVLLWQAGVRNVVLYIAIWAVTGMAAKLIFFAMGWHAARKAGYADRRTIDFPALFRDCPGLWHFVWMTNLDGMIRVLRECDIFIVNAILGPAATAVYKIARDLAQVFSQLTGPVHQAVYPELAAMAARRDHDSLRRLIRHAALLTGGVMSLGWAVFALTGPVVLALFFGPAYAGAFPVALWMLAAMVVWGFSQPLAPALLALGRAREGLAVHAVTALAYTAILAGFCRFYGLAGAGAAFPAFHLLWAGGSLLVLKKGLK